MDLSDHYGEIDIGVKAAHEHDFSRLPVDSYVTREQLESIQESFWSSYIEVRR